ncbi:MAG TPA: cupin domain-containing protein [Gaiellaceae bacterium]|nr:cupin domain-containing protein [Gaiellaceae bacterium]
MSESKVAHIDDFELLDWRETKTGRVRHELGITAFGVNTWVGPNVGDRVIPEHAEDQEGDPDELYVVVRGHARFEVDGKTIDAPHGTLVYVPAGPTHRTAFAEEAGTTVLAVGATAGKAYEPHGWELWGPLHPLFEQGDYEGVIAKGRETIEANPQYAMPLYNLACAESLGGHPQDALRHLRMAIDASPGFRDLAREDSDLDAIREEQAFRELVA